MKRAHEKLENDSCPILCVSECWRVCIGWEHTLITPKPKHLGSCMMLNGDVIQYICCSSGRNEPKQPWNVSKSMGDPVMRLIYD